MYFKLKNLKLSLLSDTRQINPFSLFLYKVVVEILANTIREEKEMKYIQIGKKERKKTVTTHK